MGASRPLTEALESRRYLAGDVVPTNVDISRMTGNEAEPAITIDKSNPTRLFATSKVTPEVGLMVAYSLDSGATWKSRLIADGTDQLPIARTDPVATYDGYGNLYFSYITPNWDIVVTLSTDNGKSFKEIAQFHGSVDQPTIVAGPGVVYLSWFEGNRLAVSGAPVTGKGQVGAFSKTQYAADSDKGNYGDIAIGPKGQVMITYQSPTVGNDKGRADIFINVDPDGLGPAGFNKRLFVTKSNVQAYDAIPAQNSRTVDAETGIAYDRSGGAFTGRVYMAYTHEPIDESNDTEIMLQYSDDDGRTWSKPQRVNDDATLNSQFLPRIALDQTSGNLALSWHDARNDKGDRGFGDTNGVPNDDAQLYATTVTPGKRGLTIAPNIRVSAGTSNAAAAANRVEYGDYSGLDFHAGAFYPAWADNSNSVGNNPEGTLKTFDLYTARVTYDAATPFATTTATTTFATTSTKKDNKSDLLG